MMFLVQFCSLRFLQCERSHKRDEDVLSKINSFIREECDIVSHILKCCSQDGRKMQQAIGAEAG